MIGRWGPSFLRGGIMRLAVISLAMLCALAPAARADERYDREYIGFDEVWWTPQPGVVGHFIAAWQGKYKQPLEGAAFYGAAGRDDLARQYEARSARRSALVLAGVAVAAGSMIGGIAYANSGAPFACSPANPAFSACASQSFDQTKSRFAAGFAISAAGGLLGTVLAMAGART